MTAPGYHRLAKADPRRRCTAPLDARDRDAARRLARATVNPWRPRARPAKASGPQRNGSNPLADGRLQPHQVLPLKLSHPRSATCRWLRSDGARQEILRHCHCARGIGRSAATMLRHRARTSSPNSPASSSPGGQPGSTAALSLRTRQCWRWLPRSQGGGGRGLAPCRAPAMETGRASVVTLRDHPGWADIGRNHRCWGLGWPSLRFSARPREGTR